MSRRGEAGEPDDHGHGDQGGGHPNIAPESPESPKHHRFAASLIRRDAVVRHDPSAELSRSISPAEFPGRRCYGPGSSRRDARPAITGVDASVSGLAQRAQRSAVVRSERARRLRDRVVEDRLEQGPRVEELLAKRGLAQTAPRTMLHPMAADCHPGGRQRSHAVGIEEEGSPIRPATMKKVAERPRARSAGSACSRSDAFPSSNVIRTSSRPATESSTASNASAASQTASSPGSSCRSGSPMPWKVRVIAGRPKLIHERGCPRRTCATGAAPRHPPQKKLAGRRFSRDGSAGTTLDDAPTDKRQSA